MIIVEFLKKGGWMVIPILITILGAWSMLLYKLLDLKRQTKTLAIWQEQVKNHQRPSSFSDHEDTLREQFLDTVQTWQSGLNTLHTLGSLLPMLGLLGTVSGIIHVFSVLGFGSGDTQLIAKGIGEALVNTQLGLFGAIPTLFGYNYLSNQVEHLRHHYKKVCLASLESANEQ